ncbi:MAG TPA: aspartate kinase [Blattabacteriaceae bacterium]
MEIKITKFGGSSVRNAQRIKKIYRFFRKIGGKKIIITSALGKTTNFLESFIKKSFLNKNIYKVYKNHIKILYELLPKSNNFFNKIDIFFSDLKIFLKKDKLKVDFIYDQVICQGELISTKIISEYLHCIGIENIWLDVRKSISTNKIYRYGIIDCTKSFSKITRFIIDRLNFTQGFIGSDFNYFTTTLGREGSDYSSSIFASLLEAKSKIICKEVPGIINSDPWVFSNSRLLYCLSYEGSVEFSYYGASFLHTKTLVSIQKRKIKLHFLSYLMNEKLGTSVRSIKKVIAPNNLPYFFKKNHILLSFYSIDLFFIKNEYIGRIFQYISFSILRVHLMKNFSLKLTLCIEESFHFMETFFSFLKKRYKMKFYERIYFYTIKNFDIFYLGEFTCIINIIYHKIKNGIVKLAIKTY